MFVVIVCSKCNGESQADESAIGRSVECPLCGQATLARTREAVLPVAKPLQTKPLSLDDAEQLPSEIKSAPRVRPPQGDRKRPRPKRSPVHTAIYWSLSLLTMLILMAGIYGAFHYHDGDVHERAFTIFSPPGGNCTIQMPGEPVAEDIPVEGLASLGGKRFSVVRWFDGVQVEFGWIDFDAAQLEGAMAPPGNRGVMLDQIAVPFRKREIERLGGKVDGESLVNFVAGKRSLEVKQTRIILPSGKAILQVYLEPDAGHLKRHAVPDTKRANVFEEEANALALTGMWMPLEIDYPFERKVLDPDQKIRMYFAEAKGNKITPETPWVTKFFNSFAPN